MLPPGPWTPGETVVHPNPARLAGLALVAVAASWLSGRDAGATVQPAAPATPTNAGPPATAVVRDDEAALNGAADDYVRLVLAAGRHDPRFVAGYCGPASWRGEAEEGQPLALVELRSRARALLARLRALPASPRREFLSGQVAAIEACLLRLSGQPMSLRDEARRMFGIDPPVVSADELEDARAKVDETVMGDRTLPFRVGILTKEFRVKREKLPAVVDAALALLRTRTAALVTLPKGERVRVEYVTGKPWRTHATYLGNFATLMEIDTDVPLELADVLAFAAREGYPGHHLINVLRDEGLARARGWHEYWVQPPDSPESVITEGTAAVGLDAVMDKAAQRAFLRDVLVPVAGLHTWDLDEYLDYREAARPLARADDVAVRMLLDDGRPDSEVEEYLERVGLRSAAVAKMALEFFRAYRSYVFARSVGAELVGKWVGAGSDRGERLVSLLERPVTPADLAAQH
jgi:hypothetical protein